MGEVNEMIMRVAKALYEIQPDTDDDGHVIPWAAFGPGDDREACINAAIVAIQAMREPTEAMVKAGEETIFEHRAGPADWSLDATREGWQASIDAALT